jgi:hypothetical protein
MPYSTEDLLHTLDRQHHEEFEAQIRETERLRQELENLKNPKDDEKSQGHAS